jgi:rare lipoprotein A
MITKTLRSKYPREKFPDRKRTKPFVCLVTAFLVVSGASGNLFASAIEGKASWYSVEACKYNPHKGCPTASGESLYEFEKKKIDFAAMWKVKFGTRVRVTNVKTGKSVDVVVLDRGPSERLNRKIDLSKSAFEKIADPKEGIINVKAEVIP